MLDHIAAALETAPLGWASVYNLLLFPDIDICQVQMSPFSGEVKDK